MQINFANDLGYGSCKGYLNGSLFKMLSMVAPVSKGSEIDPIDFVNKGKDFENEYMNHYLEHMDMSIQTSNYDSGRNLIGRNAYNAGVQPVSFDVNGMSRKSSSNLAIILTLSLIAGKTLWSYYQKNNHLPQKSLDADVTMTTALPIMEGKRNNALKNYAERYRDHKFTVSVFNLSDQPITVNVKFKHVLVKLEGQVAVYSIKHASTSLRQKMMNDFYNHYHINVSNSNEITDVSDSVSIDVGEGTTDLATFSANDMNNNPKLNPLASESIHNGYGKVLQRAVPEVQSNQVNVGSRAELKNILNQKTDIFNATRKKVCEKAVLDNTRPLVKQISEALSSTLEMAKSTKIIYVYGGGAIPLVKPLRKALMEKTKQFNNGKPMFIIFIDKNYSQYMNVDGLELILNGLLMFLKLKQK